MRSPSTASFPSLDPHVGRDLRAWRTRVLDGILRGIFVIWMFALVSGIYNVVEAYREESHLYENPFLLAVLVSAVYVLVSCLMGFITFNRKLRYGLRAGILLFILYALGVIGLLLASFSGDGRIFLFAFIVLAAILFDLPYNISAFVISLVTWLVIGWLEVNRVVIVPSESQVNSTDLSAWVSGSIIFLVLSVAAYISITYLLRALGRSLQESREGLEREQRLTQVLRTIGNINQLIVREHDSARLLLQACEHLVAGRGYTFVWIGLLEADGVTLKLAASAGETIVPDQFTTRLDQEGVGPTCAAKALHSRSAIRVPENDPCLACPLLSRYPRRSSVALPLVREDHNIGVLVVDQTAGTDLFDPQEIALLEELADDLAYALENLRAAEQQSALAEISTALLFARDEDMLWMEVIAAVQSLLRADRVAIYLYDRETDRLSCPRYYGLSAEYVAEINRRFHDVPGSAILSEPKPVIVQDVEADARAAALREWMLREGFRSYAVFPFYTSKGMTGAFTAYRNPPGPFTASDLAAGGTLVRMIGLALENADLNLQALRKASELGALYAAAQDMASSFLDSQALLRTLARHMTETLQATSAYISAVDVSAGAFKVAAEYWSDRAAPAERKSDLGREYAFAEYPAFRQTLTSGKVVLLHADDAACSEAERAQFAEYGVRSILFVPVLARGRVLGGIEIWESRRKREFTQAEMLLAQSMAAHAGSVLENAALCEQTRRQADELALAYDNTLAGWARALELRDEMTEGHTRRVTELTLRLARSMGLGEEQIVHIRRGAILHDVGKMGIPDSILLKRGDLDRIEREVMNRHPQYAYDMLSPIAFLHPALDIPLCHHEHWDGSGYPRGLKGADIPLAARIFAVADVWDAVTSERPYRLAWSKEEAHQYIVEQSGKYFDPEIVKIFLSLNV
ncbi:MAG: hypothetical protein AUJ21_04165 [Anaerolineae bacterium CG1_02_58_13]|nr:MAG: hypothetical protein AUJ21_04165 [Anaerolineae bacterium CG1_02_58_13]